MQQDGRTASLLERLQPAARDTVRPFGAPGRHVLFFSATGGTERAVTVTANGNTFEAAWATGARLVAEACPDARWLRLDWVEEAAELTVDQLRRVLADTKRNYFRFGISLDEGFKHAFLETEINANAMLYGGNKIDHAVLNGRNFALYARSRHGIPRLDLSPSAPIWVFRTQAMFLAADEADPVMLHGAGRNAGRRVVERLAVEDLDGLVAAGASYLARQVGPDGRFVYGYHPCFDRQIGAYNSLRHASTLYSMLEAWEVTRDGELRHAIERAADHLIEKLIYSIEAEGRAMAFLVEENGEIKLGGSGVCLLALVKYSELFETDRFRDLLDRLGEGVLHMQDDESGAFRHVLEYPSLAVKDAFRIIYYEGEAAFGLMRLYGLTGDPRWLQAVERAFRHFIRQRHWKAHDHWLGYCVNELTKHRPSEAYFRFGLRNFRSHLDFVLERITTFPTLLELMTSAEQLVARLDEMPQHRHLREEVDLDTFYQALHFRAHYLLNGHFWPELAMFYARPDKIAGSFFIRHHAFRVRIDDVEHYLSGLIAYRRFLLERGERHPADPALLEWREKNETGWNARNLPLATGGVWRVRPPEHWKATGVFIHPPGFVPGRIAAVRLREGEKGVAPEDLLKDPVKPAAVLASDPQQVPLDVPKLWVENPQQAVMDMARYARERFTGRVLGVTGSAGKTTMVAMMAHVLRPFGLVGQTSHNANLPLGVAWNLASMRWTDPHIVLELSIGRMAQSAQLARPDLAIFTNILPAHLVHHNTVQQVARLKSRMFLGMAPGSVAVLNREMDEWETVHAAALARGLRVVHYGRSEECECRLIEYDPATEEVEARIAGKPLRYKLAASGEHMALNSLAAISAARALGHPIEPVLAQIATFTPIAGRGRQFEAAVGGKRISVIDEAYNANPGSMKAALGLLGGKERAGRRIAVLGEMAELGPDAKAYHTQLAPLIAANAIDRVHVIGELYEEFWEALPPSCRGSRPSSIEQMMECLKSDLASGDCVLFKGSHSTGVHRLVEGILPFGVSARAADARRTVDSN